MSQNRKSKASIHLAVTFGNFGFFQKNETQL